MADRRNSCCKDCAIENRVNNHNLKRQKYLFRDNEYTLSEISYLTGIPLKLIWSRIHQSKLSVEEAVKIGDRREKPIGGFRSIKEASTSTGIPSTRLSARKRLGQSDSKALSQEYQAGFYQIYKEEQPRRLKDWWVDPRRGVKNQSTFRDRIRRGIPLQVAFETQDDMDCRYVEIDGVKKSSRQWAIDLNICPATFFYRMHPFQREYKPNVIRKCIQCKRMISIYLAKGKCSRCAAKDRRQAWKDCGLCCKCGGHLDDKQYLSCSQCRIRKRINNNKNIKKCTDCGFKKPHHGKGSCKRCYGWRESDKNDRERRAAFFSHHN